MLWTESPSGLAKPKYRGTELKYLGTEPKYLGQTRIPSANLKYLGARAEIPSHGPKMAQNSVLAKYPGKLEYPRMESRKPTVKALWYCLVMKHVTL